MNLAPPNALGPLDRAGHRSLTRKIEKAIKQAHASQAGNPDVPKLTRRQVRELADITATYNEGSMTPGNFFRAVGQVLTRGKTPQSRKIGEQMSEVANQIDTLA